MKGYHAEYHILCEKRAISIGGDQLFVDITRTLEGVTAFKIMGMMFCDL